MSSGFTVEDRAEEIREYPVRCHDAPKSTTVFVKAMSMQAAVDSVIAGKGRKATREELILLYGESDEEIANSIDPAVLPDKL